MDTYRIAVLITCYNRKLKTISCIEDIINQKGINGCEVSVFIIDGGSSDGTVEMVKKLYPQVFIKVCEGMFWAGGMRVAWEEAASHGIYDYFFLVNDDTYLFPDALARLLKADEECLSIYGKKGVYVGTTIDPNTRVRSYGGLTTDGRVNTEVFPSNDTLLECDLTNANILLVSRPVYDCIGGLSDKYTHGIADYDYSLRAKRNGFPVLIGKGYYGECVRDHGPRWCNPDVPLRKRIKYLYSPKGLAYKETLCYMKEYFPKRYLYTIVNYWAKTLFPSLWKKKTKAYNEH